MDMSASIFHDAIQRNGQETRGLDICRRSPDDRRLHHQG